MVQKNPLLKAEDLLNEGIPAGKVMGKLLLEAEKIAVNEKILDKAHLLKKLKTNELWPFR